jgi:hypothetical protein
MLISNLERHDLRAIEIHQLAIVACVMRYEIMLSRQGFHQQLTTMEVTA